MTRTAGRHFLQIPGPTNVPDRILRAMDRPTIDHRGEAFAEIGRNVLARLKHLCGASVQLVLFAGSGSGAWEAALVNTLSPGDRVLMYETGHFGTQWSEIARRLGLLPEILDGDWRSGADADAIAERLEADREQAIKAVCIIHNETSTGCVTPVADIRGAIDAAGHPALLMVDTISSLASMPYQADRWGVDVTVGASQKGLMMPPGLSFNAMSERALAVARQARLPKAYWAWQPMLEANAGGFFPYTPATNMLFGLSEALDMLEEEGLENVFLRHARHAHAVRKAVEAWGLELQCARPAHASNSVTAVRMPVGCSADEFRRIVLQRFDMSLGNGLSRLADRVFRIGHLGDFNDLSMIATLSGVEMGFQLANVPHRRGGVLAAMDALSAGPTADHKATGLAAAPDDGPPNICDGVVQ